MRRRTWLCLQKEVLFFGEAVFEGEEAEEFAPGTILEDEVEFFLILEAVFEVHEEGVVEFGEDAFFGHDVLLLVLFEDVLFLEDFHGVDLVVVLAPHQEHFGVGASADH